MRHRLRVQDFLRYHLPVAMASAAGASFDYYISPTGDDTTGDGSVGSPWKTLSKALGEMSNGQSVGVMDGTYPAALGVTSSLDSITIAAVSGASPVFIGEAALTGWTKTDGYTNVYEKTTGTVYAALYGTTRLTVQTSIANVDATESSCYYTGGTCYVHVAGGGDPDDGGGVYCGQSTTVGLTLSGAGVTLRGITFSYYIKCLALSGASPVVADCAFAYQSVLYSSSTTYCVIAVSGAGGTISGCSFTEVGSAFDTGRAISLNEGSQDVTITSCTFDRTGCYMIIVVGTTGHVVSNCTGHDGSDGMIAVSAGGSATVSYGTSYDTKALIIVNGAGATATVHHCVQYLSGEVAPNLSKTYGYIAEQGGTLNVYHCVASHLQRSTSGEDGFYALSGGTIVAKNCAAYNCDKAFVRSTSGTPGVMVNDYNALYANEMNYIDCDAGAHDVTGDPLFTDADNQDFTLGAGSPLIDAGVAVAGINDDYQGSAPDIGRWERG